MVLDMQYRNNVGIMMLNDKNEIFIGKRADKTMAWQMPQGGIKYGELAEKAMLRELEEETGIKAKNVQMVREYPVWLQYDFPDNIRNILWRGRYRGQKQKWFLLKLIASKDNININTKNFEFDDWKWADVQEVLSLVVDFKKGIYIKVIDYFMYNIIN